MAQIEGYHPEEDVRQKRCGGKDAAQQEVVPTHVCRHVG